jgi:hypothetical protein
MTNQEMSERIVSIVAERDHVSFVELIDACGPDAIGDLQLELKPNLVLWVGVSPIFEEAFHLALKRIRPYPDTPMVYFMDGRALNLPIAKSIRAFKQPRWLPVTFRLNSGI